jgi:hypothetical protein
MPRLGGTRITVPNTTVSALAQTQTATARLSVPSQIAASRKRSAKDASLANMLAVLRTEPARAGQEQQTLSQHPTQAWDTGHKLQQSLPISEGEQAHSHPPAQRRDLQICAMAAPSSKVENMMPAYQCNK